MKTAGKKRRSGPERPGVLLFSAILSLLLGGAAFFSLRADTGGQGDLSNFQAGEGTPTKGESGWINLPYLGGVTKIKAADGKILFEGMKRLHQEGLLPRTKGTADASFVLEGADAYLGASLVFSGNPVVTVTSLPCGWQALFSGPFAAFIDPLLVRPWKNNLGFFLPAALEGGIIRFSTPGLPSLYGLVDGQHLLLSWQALVNLAKAGNGRVTIEAFSTQAGYFRAVLECSRFTGALTVTFGR